MRTRQHLLKKLVKVAGKKIRIMTPNEGIVLKEGIGNFATAADLESERIIIEMITKQFPDDTILAEETASDLTDQELLSSNHLWIIDPIDGTNNFKNRRGYSSVSVGYAEKGIVKAGAVYNFDRDELFYAEKDKGAFVNGEKISVGNQTDITQGVIATDPYYTSEGTRRNIQLILKIDPTPLVFMRGAATLEMCEVASGRTDLYVHTLLKPWDNAAAFLIVEEAGGVVKNLQGEDITFLSPTAVVGNAKLVEQLIECAAKT